KSRWFHLASLRREDGQPRFPSGVPEGAQSRDCLGRKPETDAAEQRRRADARTTCVARRALHPACRREPPRAARVSASVLGRPDISSAHYRASDAARAAASRTTSGVSPAHRYREISANWKSAVVTATDRTCARL